MSNKDNDKVPRLARFILRQMTIYNERHSIVDDFAETFSEKRENEGRFRANSWYWLNVLKSFPKYAGLLFSWRIIMLRNYLKIAFRQFASNRLYSFINVFGLAIGIATCMIINFWVQRELSYDRFHKNADRIYRVERRLFRDNAYSRWPITSGAYRQALIDDLPEIENAVRFWRREFSIKDHRGIVHRQPLFAVDNSIFAIFDFELLKGNPGDALSQPRTVVLTEQKALTYLGTTDVLGRSLFFEWQGEQVDFKITGVLKDIPDNSHIQFDMLISIATYPDDRFNDWRSNYLYTYLLTSEDAVMSDLASKLRGFVTQHLESHYGDLTGGGADIHDVLKMYLFPMTDLHLHPSVNWEIGPGGNESSVYIFSSIAVLILIIACINFINLSTARANKRAKEVSLRKTIGARRGQLQGQFIQESLFLAIMALILASFLISLFIPVYNFVFAEQMSVASLWQAQNILILIAITFGVGLLAGLYPSFYLTRFEPANVLKGNTLSGSRKSAFRRNMVIIQFIISVTLIIGMVTVYKQMQYIQSRSLGYDKENVVLIPVRSRQVVDGYKAFRSGLLRSPKIISVAASSDVPSDRLYSNTNFANAENQNESYSISYMQADYDFVDTYGMEVISGRNFSRDFATDTSGTIMLNEAAAQRYSWSADEAVGRVLSFFDTARGRIVGVVKDFNFKSVHTEIEPLILLLSPNYLTMISARIKPGDFGQTIGLIEQEWGIAFPTEHFEFNFLDERLDQLYLNEMQMQKIFMVFSMLSILVACLGLFGLAAFTAEIRTKEIGIRKVLGATTRSVILLLSREFTKWIIFANIVAWPIAWLVMSKWLQNFAYRINMDWLVFILSGVFTLFIALSTSAFQAIKTAYTNPVNALKYE